MHDSSSGFRKLGACVILLALHGGIMVGNYNSAICYLAKMSLCTHRHTASGVKPKKGITFDFFFFGIVKK